jgi:glycosyltransferase involved in cell wall biosynthesis
MKNYYKVVHLTSVHPRYDMRIFFKMCITLALNNYITFIIVADGKGTEVKNGIKILDVGAPVYGRLIRMIKTTSDIFKKAKELDAHIYHIHDPELIWIGVKLKKLGKKVIYDSHEDLPSQILIKPYISRIFRIIFSKFASIYERIFLPKFDALIVSTQHIRNRLSKINPNCVNINNFAVLKKSNFKHYLKHKKREIVYAGGISEKRGIGKILSAIGEIQNLRFNLAGNFIQKKYKDNLKKRKNWSKVNEHGFLNQEQLKKVYCNSLVGMVTLFPEPNYIVSLPNKMFEYMAIGLPVIASNFPLWRKIIEDNNCGICVDPLDSKAIRNAIQYLIDNPVIRLQMGKNGYHAVKKRYNWFLEQKKLLRLYKTLL